MKPRLSSSKKWTAFPKEFSDQIKEVFDQNFNDLVTEGKFIVDGRIYAEEILLRVGYLQKGRIKQANFEVSQSYSQDKQDALEKIHECVDSAASMLLEYVEKDGDVDFPLHWKEYTFQNHKIYLQYSTVNTDLEAQANQLLSEIDASLVQEDAEDLSDEDALARAEIDEELSGVEDVLGDEEPSLADDVLITAEVDDSDDDEFDETDDESMEDATDDEASDDKGPRLFGRPRKKKKDNLH